VGGNLIVNKKLDIFKEAICCPRCHGTVTLQMDRCPKCENSFSMQDHQLVFNDVEIFSQANTSWLNEIKDKVKKRVHFIYPLLVDILSPVARLYSPLSFLPKEDIESGLVVNLGCGTTHFGPRILNLDQAKYHNVDIVAELERLPFKDNSVDAIINIAVLEHVSNPETVVKEFYRILKPGGIIFCLIPFMQGIHASPFDFRRYTPEGIPILFDGFSVGQIYPLGPTSGLLWVVQEWLALILSFGSSTLYKIIFPLTWILSPLKFLDIFLKHHPQASVVSTAFYFTAKKLE
jgi:SAM-dependent methyltransferase